jgi:hypothetical protein
MKKSMIITAVFAALLSIAACERMQEQGPSSSEEGIRLTFSCGDINTRTDKPGVGNENLIKTLDVFLFTDAYPEYRHHWRFTPEIESDFTCFIQAAVIQKDTTYKVFSIANYPGPSSDFVIGSKEATMPQLQALALSESAHRTFTAEEGGNIMPAADKDLCLVMTGLAENILVTVVPGQTLVGEATVLLKRLPAKVTMDFYLKDEVTHDKGHVTEVWTPLTDGSNIRAYLCNGSSETLIGGASSPSYFDYFPNINNTVIPGKPNFSTAFTSASFYTYPESWSYGSATEPYIKLIVPWKLSRSTSGIVQESQKEYYYKVMLPTNAFESNNWYHLILDVTQLGGDADDEAVNVPCGYQVMDWRTGTEISSTMSPGFYLDVNVPDPLNVKFYGNTLDIPYFASGTVAIRSKTLEYKDFSSGTTVTESNTAKVAKASDGDYIHISNTLRYDFTTDSYDVSPFKYTIVLQLANDDIGQYDKTLVVTQYPPLFITSTDTRHDTNSEPNVYINATSSTSGNIRVWDSSGTSTTGTMGATHYPHYLGSVGANTTSVPATPNGNNQNPNIYSVTTTILKFTPLANGVEFPTVLGDPRAAETNEFSGVLTGNISGDDCTNYRPTAEDTQNVISPKFISASSYGKTYAVSYEGARKRCAAYQEYGYPAGRWRLPTQAEILFLQKLNSDGKIPTLFGPSTTNGYWAAGNLLYVKGSSNEDLFLDMSGATNNASSDAVRTNLGGTNYQGFIRCVYDTWYWGDGHSQYTNSRWLGYKTSLTDTF